jgi:hypothetical protein
MQNKIAGDLLIRHFGFQQCLAIATSEIPICLANRRF